MEEVQPTPEAPLQQQTLDTTEIVDRKALYRMINALIKGQSQVYVGYGGLVHLKALFSLPDSYEECQKKWAEIQAFLAKEPW